MARPLKQGLDYFPHDTDALNDEKIQCLMALHGAAGYAFYFIMLERVFRAENGRITLENDFIRVGLARSMCLSVEDFNAILATSLDVGCFDRAAWEKEKAITSPGVQRRLEKISHLREVDKRRKAISKEKESTKEKDIKGKKKEKAKNGKLPENPRKTFIPPSIEEVKAYCLERNNGIDPQHFIDSNTAKGWVIGKNQTPMKDWRATIRTWEKTNGNGSKKETSVADKYPTL